jgi:hypothetical protein
MGNRSMFVGLDVHKEWSDPGYMSASDSHSSSASGSSKSSRVISCGRRADRASFAFRRVGEACPNILARQLREVAQDLVLGHSAGEVSQHVANRDPGSTDAWLPKSDACVYCDSLEQIHGRSLR